MEIFPAIDLQEGQCVRLTLGDFDSTTVYETDPLRQARSFAEAGARWLHVVDLDGTRDGVPRHTSLITQMVEETPLKVQVGGGIRDAETIETLLAAGAERVVIGSLAVREPDLVRAWLKHFGPNRIVLALDVTLANGTPEVLAQGWTSNSRLSLWDLLKRYAGSGLATLLCTDTSRDGMLSGTNQELYALLRQREPQLAVLASGGVKDIDDLKNLKHIGVAGVVIGKALYEKRFRLSEALKLADKPNTDSYVI